MSQHPEFSRQVVLETFGFCNDQATVCRCGLIHVDPVVDPGSLVQLGWDAPTDTGECPILGYTAAEPGHLF